VAVFVGVGVFVGVSDGVCVCVGVNDGVGVFVGVGVGVGVPHSNSSTIPSSNSSLVTAVRYITLSIKISNGPIAFEFDAKRII
jgi:hypothetical protein